MFVEKPVKAVTDLIAYVGRCYEHNKRSKISCSKKLQCLEKTLICYG